MTSYVFGFWKTDCLNPVYLGLFGFWPPTFGYDLMPLGKKFKAIVLETGLFFPGSKLWKSFLRFYICIDWNHCRKYWFHIHEIELRKCKW